MSSAPKNLHNFALPVLKWAHKNPTSPRHRSKLSDPSSQPDSDDPNQEPTQQQPAADVEADGSSVKPWNLRPRKSVSTQSNEAVYLDGEPHKNERREKNKPKLWISLTKEEIEEDLYSMTGLKATRRPKKRTKTVQKQLDVY